MRYSQLLSLNFQVFVQSIYKNDSDESGKPVSLKKFFLFHGFLESHSKIWVVYWLVRVKYLGKMLDNRAVEQVNHCHSEIGSEV